MSLHEGNSAHVHYNDSHWDAPGMNFVRYLGNLSKKIQDSSWRYGGNSPSRLIINPKIEESLSKELEKIDYSALGRASTSIDNGVITKLFGYPVEIGDDRQVDQFIIIWEGL